MGIFLVIISAFGFSTLGIFGKLAMDSGIQQLDALLLRFLFAIPLFAVILFFKKAFPKKAAPFVKAIVIGGIGVGVESTLFFFSLPYLGAGLTAVFLYLYPAFVALLSRILFKEKLTLLQWCCIGLSLVGCLLTVEIQSKSFSLIGIYSGVATGAWYALYILAANWMSKDQNPLTMSAGVTLGSFIFFLIIAVFSAYFGEGVQTHKIFYFPVNINQWGIVLGLASLATVLPFATLYAGMKKLGPTRTSIFSTLEIVFTLILAVSILGENLTLKQWLGAILILLSVLLMKLNR